MNKKVITRGDSNAVMLLTGINDLKFSKKNQTFLVVLPPSPYDGSVMDPLWAIGPQTPSCLFCEYQP